MCRAYSYSDLKERAIIFTADDFGMCHSVNEAVIDLFEGDAIQSAMIMMPCPLARCSSFRLCEDNCQGKFRYSSYFNLGKNTINGVL